MQVDGADGIAGVSFASQISSSAWHRHEMVGLRSVSAVGLGAAVGHAPRGGAGGNEQFNFGSFVFTSSASKKAARARAASQPCSQCSLLPSPVCSKLPRCLWRQAKQAISVSLGSRSAERQRAASSQLLCWPITSLGCVGTPLAAWYHHHLQHLHRPLQQRRRVEPDAGRPTNLPSWA